jgi:hypothetical protein
MRKWILASQAEKKGRLYWSVGRGWTYLELAKLYAEPTRETIQIQPIGAKPCWFEVEVSANSFRKVLEPQERPQITDLSNLWRDQAIPSRTFTVRGMPNCVQVHPGYSVNIYLKAAS